MIADLIALLLTQSSSDLDTALDVLAAVKPGDAAACAAAREKVLAFGKDAVPALSERGAPERWTSAGWVRAMAAEACRLRLANPELAAAVDRPAGLDPAEYGRFRRPVPVVLPELARKGADAVPLLLERWRWTFEEHRFSPAEAGEDERESFRKAILALPGRIADPRARHFLAETLATAGLRDSWRQEAAVSLGMVGGTEALPSLTRILDDATQPAAVREACARAVGRIPDPAALDAIIARVAGEKDAQIRRSFLHGLGLLGSSWAWESRGKASAATADRVRAGCADALVEALRRTPAESETVGIALSLTAWPASLAAVESLASDASASLETRAAASSLIPGLRQALSRRQAK
jgi:HEAT repeat protein